MATLSNVKKKFTTVAKWGGLIFGILILIFFLIKLTAFVKEIISPTQPPAPEAKFGKLSPINFPQGIKRNFKYSIDTISGELPVFSQDRINVYKIGVEEPDILAVEKMNTRLSQLGFSSKPEQLSDTVYRWQDSNTLLKSLVLNVYRGEFILTTNFLLDQTLLFSNNIPTDEEATAMAKNFLETLSMYPPDLDENKTKAIRLSVKNGAISEATSISNTKLISVYFFQKDIDGLPIVYPIGNKSTINITIAGGGFDKEIIDARYFYQKITDESSEYSIITAEDAFEKLKKGEAYIVSFDLEKSDVVIKNVYLGFYLGKNIQKYLMPVVIFEGTNNFIAYVSAITDEWIGN